MRGIARIIIAIAILLSVCSFCAAQSTQPAPNIREGKYERQSVGEGSKNQEGEAARTVQSYDSTPQIGAGRVALALGIVIAMILIMRWAGKKFFPGAGVPHAGGAMKILSRLAISPKQQLLMVQVGRRVVVVGDSGGQMGALSEITDSEEIAFLVSQIAEQKSQTTFKTFSSLFRRVEKDYEEQPDTDPENETVGEIELPQRIASTATETEIETPVKTPADEEIEEAHGEIGDLAEKVRQLSAQFRQQT